MSAVFGIISTSGKPIDPAWVEQMRANLAHRGPDGQGVWQEGDAVLGHCLLRVTPESQYESSPLLLEHLVVAADARLDERELLMDKLRIPHAQRPETTDPELIGRAYLQWHDRSPEHLCGDFAFAIWDRREKRLFCARDHVGVKPLLYAFAEGYFCWASGMKAVVQAPFVRKELSRKHMLEFCAYLPVLSGETIWQDVYRLMPAHVLVLESGKLRLQKYWGPENAEKVRFARPEQYVEAFRNLLTRAVTDRLRTKYEVGSMLSGGLDSSAVTCIAAQHLRESGRKVFTCSSVLPDHYEGPPKDEREFIDLVVSGEPNIEAEYVDEQGLSFYTGLFEAFDRRYQPPNGFYYLDEAIATRFQEKGGIRRVLMGYFGDVAASNWHISPLPFLLMSGRWKAFFRFFRRRKQLSGFTTKKLIKKELIMPVLPLWFIDGYRKLRGQEKTYDLDYIPLRWQPGERENILRKVASYESGPERLSYRKSLWAGTEDFFLEEFDELFARYGMEIAYPLADKRLIEFLWGIPPEMLQYDGVTRGLFRQAVQGIVAEPIAWRKSKGAYSPRYVEILHQGLRELMLVFLPKWADNPETMSLDISRLKKIFSDLENSTERSNFVHELLSMHKSLAIGSFQTWFISQKLKNLYHGNYCAENKNVV